MTAISLRPYQEEAVQAAEDARARGVKRGLLSSPVGSGKTVIFSELIRRTGGTALILAHREELLQQAAAKLARVAPETSMSIGFVKAGLNDVNAPIVAASVPTLARESRLRQLPTDWDLVIVDEAHHAVAPSWQRVLDHVGDSFVLGVTATPERSDDGKLGDVFDELIYARSLLDMIRDGYLVAPKGLRVEIEGLDLRSVRKSSGDWQSGDLGRAMEEADAPSQIAATMAEHASDRKSVVFTPTIEVAHHAAAAINRVGIPAAALDGETPKEERADILRRFSTGELRCCVNVGVLTEGYDEPSIDCVVMARPTQSRGLYVQCIGRGLRLHPGKDDCLLVDLVGVSSEMKLQSLPDLFELNAPPQPDENVLEALEREERERARAAGEAVEETRAREAGKAEEVELFSRQSMSWHEIEGRWVISIGEEMFALDPHEGSWRVLLVRDSGARILASGLDLGYAMGSAEESIRRDPERFRLARQDAGWRKRPRSEPQRRALQALGAENGQTTAGEASDAITEAIATERLQKLDAALERQATEKQEAIR